MRISLAAFLLLAAVPATAQEVEVTPFAGYRFGGGFDLAGEDGPLEVKPSAAWGAALSLRLAEDGEVEAVFARQSTRLAADGFFTSAPLFDLVVESYQLGGNYLFAEEQARVRPYVGVGFGFTRLVPEAAGLESETRFSASLAGGLKVYLGARFGLRFEARGFVTVMESERRVFCDSFGGCVVRASGSELSQGEVRGGLIFRF